MYNRWFNQETHPVRQARQVNVRLLFDVAKPANSVIGDAGMPAQVDGMELCEDEEAGESNDQQVS